MASAHMANTAKCVVLVVVKAGAIRCLYIFNSCTAQTSVYYGAKIQQGLISLQLI